MASDIWGVNEEVAMKMTALLLVCANAVAHDAGTRVELDANNVHYVYESRAAVKAPIEKLAKLVSVDYRTGDEFTRREMLPQLKLVIKEGIEHAKEISEVTVKIQTGFTRYNFDKGGFPTGISNGSAMSLAEGYVVVLENANGAAFISADVERAKGISRRKPLPKFLLIKVEGTMTRAVEKATNYTNKNLYLRLTAIEVSLPDGTLVGRKAL